MNIDHKYVLQLFHNVVDSRKHASSNAVTACIDLFHDVYVEFQLQERPADGKSLDELRSLSEQKLIQLTHLSTVFPQFPSFISRNLK